MRPLYFVLMLTMLCCITLRVAAQPCTLTQADLLTGPANFTIPAGQVLCITSNFCMGAASNFPGSCANSNVNSLVIDGTLRISENVIFRFAGSINGTGTIDILEGGRVNLFGSLNCAAGLKIRAIDVTITSGTSSSTPLVSCSSPGCEPGFSNGYRPFGVVTPGLGYTASGCSVITGLPTIPTTVPVVLTDFTARVQENEVALNWKTSSEQNNAGFEILRSENDGPWALAGKVLSKAPAGNSNEVLNYQYNERFSGGFASRYYRLRQVDLNGVAALSKIVLVNGTYANSIRVTTARNSVALQVYMTAGQTASVRITSAAGQVVYAANEALKTGSNTVTIPARWAKGIYVATVQTGKEVLRSRFYLP